MQSVSEYSLENFVQYYDADSVRDKDGDSSELLAANMISNLLSKQVEILLEQVEVEIIFEEIATVKPTSNPHVIKEPFSK